MIRLMIVILSIWFPASLVVGIAAGKMMKALNSTPTPTSCDLSALELQFAASMEFEERLEPVRACRRSAA